MVSTATAHSDMAPSPRVDLVIDPADLDAAAVTVTVLQLSRWGQVPVRDGQRKAVAGGLAVTDYEIPPGDPVTYRVEQFDAGGASLGFQLNLTVEVDIPEGKVVIQDPLVPGNAVMIDGRPEFAGAVKRGRDTRIYNAGTETIALTGVLSKLRDVNVSCSTYTLADADALETVLSESLVLVRTMPRPVRVPAAMFLSISEPVQLPQDVQWGGEFIVWDLVGQEISRPTIPTVVPEYTWQDVIDYYPSWADLLAGQATWLDVIRNPPPTA